MEPCDLSAVEARRLIGARQLSPVELLDSCLARVGQVNAPVNAIVAMNVERAHREARAAEDAVTKGEPLGLLHGLPVAVKDIMRTEGITTTFGSPHFRDHVPARDEAIVASIRRAGGIVFAKTNLPEWSAGGNSINPVYGVSGNPFAPELTCGGSSGGSAVALATGMTPLAVGSDNAGSVRIPASFCGVVGLRPSPGRVPSDDAAVSLSHLLVSGPMGRDVADAWMLFSAIAGFDSRDVHSAPIGSEYGHPLQPLDLSTVRVAITPDLGFAPIEADLKALFHDRARTMRGWFKSVRDEPPDFDGVERAYDILRAVLFSGTYLEQHRREPGWWGPLVSGNVERALLYDMADVGWAFRHHTTIYRRFQEYFNDIDLLICPTMGVRPWPKHELFPRRIGDRELEGYFDWVAMTFAITLVGHPAISIPSGIDSRGLPFGLQLVGPRHGDAFVMRAAVAIERALTVETDIGRPVPDLKRLSAQS
ncbi:MAG TPA: amidase family protein [Candidatus Binataceae bacterium]|nr:amidase family protein [Candidatus Binataceae bacterium]